MPEPEPTNPNPEPAPAPPVETPTPPAEPTLLSEPATPPSAEPAAPAAPPPTVLAEQVSPVNADGSFIEGWRDTLPDELKGEECLSLVKDFPGMVKQFVNQRKAIGKDKVSIPGDDAKPEDWDAFYTATGRPTTEAEYKTPDIPEGLEGIFTDERLDAAKAQAFKIGASQRQFDAYLANEIEQTVGLIKEQTDAELAAKASAEKTLRQELGAAYDERIHIANRIITEGIPNEEQRMQFLEKHGNDVDIIRLLSHVGSRLSEGTALIAELTNKTPNEINVRIAELRNTPGYMAINSDMSAERRQQITDEIQEISKQLYPAKTG